MKYLKIMCFALMASLTCTVTTSCSSDDDDNSQVTTLPTIQELDNQHAKIVVGTKTSSPDGTYTLSSGDQVTVVSGVVVSIKTADEIAKEEEETKRNQALTAVNQNFVHSTVVATYKGLADVTEDMIAAIEAIAEGGDDEVAAACKLWKDARQYWEWSESHLFGAASGYSIDPHIDTWPFDRTQFEAYMKKYNPATNEKDAAIIDEAIATGQNLTGFHAVEYLLFREGQPRKRKDINADELYFMESAANDLYLNSCILEAAWAGLDNVSSARQALLAEAEREPADNFGWEMDNSGQAGSRWKTILQGSVQIIEGCSDITDEVGNAKIASAYKEEDTSYIESPHAYNSITDFYDNIIGVKNALYGLSPSIENYNVTTPATNSVIGYALTNDALKAPAQDVMNKLETALAAINKMVRPFVKNYKDPSCGVAIDALEDLDEALGVLADAYLTLE